MPANELVDLQHVGGHSRCGGVAAALEGRRVGLVDNWLRYVQDVRDRHAELLAAIDEERRVDALGELNVIEQARHVCETTVVRDAWARGQELVVHGWFYRLQNGLLKDLRFTITSLEEIETVHAGAVAAVRQRYMPA